MHQLTRESDLYQNHLNSPSIASEQEPTKPALYNKRSNYAVPLVKKLNSRSSKNEKDVIDIGSRIKVYIRCRGRKEGGLKDNTESPIAFRDDYNREVIVKSGPMNLSKSYNYDRVFGPDTDQEMIYDSIAADTLKKILDGYNYTIFAYGQTGTGKTYTMTGDILSVGYGDIPNNTGIIPRVLKDLFQKLNKFSGEYSVKVSYIELYNEELKDLIGSDKSQKLRIYDNKTNGQFEVAVHDMEETFIESASEGLKLLQEGSKHRQAASTKANDVSSRSHSLFTITVMTRELSKGGYEQLRFGRLNLVDLAGSEAITRSGSLQDRVIETGKIHQSLLVLGRVINALVERSPHIPYRESKLTRLLQDSLGGRTETCIIATISPSKACLEETISTLEYVNRAKNIKNKPQINQTVSKKTVISEYLQEIKRLKADLQASQLQQGIYLSPERYRELLDQNENRRILVEQQELHIDLIESQLKTSKKSYQDSQEQLTSVKQDLAEAMKSLENERISSDKIQVELSSVVNQTNTERKVLLGKILTIQRHYNNEYLVRDELETTGAKLQQQGSEMISTLDVIMRDLESLNCQIDHRSRIEKNNQESFTIIDTAVGDVCNTIRNNFKSFNDDSAKATSAVLAALKYIWGLDAKKLNVTEESLNDRVSSFDTFKKIACDDLRTVALSMDDDMVFFKGMIERLDTNITARFEALIVNSGNVCNAMLKKLKSFQENVQNDHHVLTQKIHETFSGIHIKLEYQDKEIEKIKGMISGSNEAISLGLKDHAESIENIFEEEIRANNHTQKQVLEQFSNNLCQIWETQETRLATRVTDYKNSLRKTQSTVQQASGDHILALHNLSKADNELKLEMKESQRSIKSSLSDMSTSAKQQRRNIHRSSSQLHEAIATSTKSYITQLHEQRTIFEKKASAVRQRAETSASRAEACLSELSKKNHESLLSLKLTLSELNTITYGLKQSLNQDIDDIRIRSVSLSERLAQVIDNTKDVVKHEIKQNLYEDNMIVHIPIGPHSREYTKVFTKPRTREEILSSIDSTKQGEMSKQELALLTNLLGQLSIKEDEKIQLAKETLKNLEEIDENEYGMLELKSNSNDIWITSDDRPPLATIELSMINNSDSSLYKKKISKTP
ncbi:kinesin-domain-containing protein [Nadsonia fulvescens var. elongata DSM 6958]|uniref:Kinesin-like protein KIP1 n=1 Tax=Nadsonia fulvescens var. elongata DSM 6958 TaxID=857566 RepID=A0A1E3PU34_9ASCO|nr:kinesin-domain-containing protein [Nadsonia fulvescens var. elongata DSM 6958]